MLTGYLEGVAFYTKKSNKTHSNLLKIIVLSEITKDTDVNHP